MYVPQSSRLRSCRILSDCVICAVIFQIAVFTPMRSSRHSTQYYTTSLQNQHLPTRIKITCSQRIEIYTTRNKFTSAAFSPRLPKLVATSVRSMMFTTPSLFTSSNSCVGSVISASWVCGVKLPPMLSVSSTSDKRTVDALASSTSNVIVASVPS